MGCDPIFGRGNKPVGIVRSRGKRPKVGPCSCGRPGAVLCDGPVGGGKTCDKPICPRCAVSIRATNVDFCPSCARGVQPDILASCPVGASAVPCGGPLVSAEGICLHHSVLFDTWTGHHGGLAVYRQPELSREEKRQRFRDWLNTLTREQSAAMLAARNIR